AVPGGNVDAMAGTGKPPISSNGWGFAMNRVLATVFGILFVTTSVVGEVVIERVIGPEFPGPYKHPATVAELANGDLYIAYYSGEGEYEGDTAVYGMRLVHGTQEWSKPEIIADTPDRSEG